MTAAKHVISETPEATLQDVVDAVQEVNSTISQLGVEVQRILAALENMSKSLEKIAGSMNG